MSNYDHGVGVTVSGSRGDRFTEVVSTANALGGFSQDTSSDISYVNDSATNSVAGDGIAVASSSGTHIDQTIADGNGGPLTCLFCSGITLNAGTTDNHLEGNTANGNGEDGIDIELGSTTNEILGNTALGNGSFDLFDGNLVPPCDSNTWDGNTFATANQSCIH